MSVAEVGFGSLTQTAFLNLFNAVERFDQHGSARVPNVACSALCRFENLAR